MKRTIVQLDAKLIAKLEAMEQKHKLNIMLKPYLTHELELVEATGFVQSMAIDLTEDMHQLALQIASHKGTNIPILLGSAISQLFSTRAGLEAWHQHSLHAKLGGVREVYSRAGRIDLLSADGQLVEVKHASAWKHALGQAIAYGYFYPGHQLAIALFGKCSYAKALVEEVCMHNDVNVIWL